MGIHTSSDRFTRARTSISSCVMAYWVSPRCHLRDNLGLNSAVGRVAELKNPHVAVVAGQQHLLQQHNEGAAEIVYNK